VTNAFTKCYILLVHDTKVLYTAHLACFHAKQGHTLVGILSVVIIRPSLCHTPNAKLDIILCSFSSSCPANIYKLTWAKSKQDSQKISLQTAPPDWYCLK